MVELRNVTSNDYEFLFEMLKSRPAKANISHREMPSFGEHCRFVSSTPYKRWAIVVFDGKSAGNCYVTKQNEIGIFLLPEYQGKGIGKQAVEMLMGLFPIEIRFLANIAPGNETSKKFFWRMGFKKLQETYELRRGN